MKLHFVVGKEVHSQEGTIVPNVRDTVTLRPPASSAVSGIVLSRRIDYSSGDAEIIITLGPIEA